MKNLKIVLLGAASILMTACSSTYDAGQAHAELAMKKAEMEHEKKEAMLDEIPGWYLSPIKSDEAGFYAVGLGQSPDLASAIRISELETQMRLAGNVSQLITAQEKMFNKATTNATGRTLQTAIESFINEMDVAGTEFDRTEVKLIGGDYVVYKRGYLPVKAIQAAKDEAKFAQDLDLASQDAQLELMQRVAQAKADAQRKQRLENEERQARADERASRAAAIQAINATSNVVNENQGGN